MTVGELKKRIIEVLDELPEEDLKAVLEVAQFRRVSNNPIRDDAPLSPDIQERVAVLLFDEETTRQEFLNEAARRYLKDLKWERSFREGGLQWNV